MRGLCQDGQVYHRPWRWTAAAAAAAVIAAAAWLAAAAHAGRGKPLWPGARYSGEDRDRALARGLQSLAAFARKPEYFRTYGGDLLDAFNNIAATSRNPVLSETARRIGRERAVEWRLLNPVLPRNYGVNDVMFYVFGTDAAEKLGVAAPELRAQLAAAAPRFAAADYLKWDPAREPPPRDVPEPCPKCDFQNVRGAVTCSRCGALLKMRDVYDLYLDSLLTSYTGDTSGIGLGARYREVLKWLPAMRPYPAWSSEGWPHYYAAVYCVTHVVYTNNFYSRYRLPAECLPDEVAFLRSAMPHVLADRDSETAGELLDSLRAFGLDFSDPVIRAGTEFLLASQNPGGSWGDPQDSDPYGRYHATWTAIDGLREYRWPDTAPCPAIPAVP